MYLNPDYVTYLFQDFLREFTRGKPKREAFIVQYMHFSSKAPT